MMRTPQESAHGGCATGSPAPIKCRSLFSAQPLSSKHCRLLTPPCPPFSCRSARICTLYNYSSRRMIQNISGPLFLRKTTQWTDVTSGFSRIEYIR